MRGRKVFSLTNPVLAERLQPLIVTLRGEIDDLFDGAFRDVEDGSGAIVGKDEDRCRNAVVFAVTCLKFALRPRHATAEKPGHPLSGANGWGSVSKQGILWMRDALTVR